MKANFWIKLDKLLAEHRIVIDRPKGNTHPRYPGLVYPIDYGYLEGTSDGDRNEIDVWQRSLPGRKLVGIACTVDLTKKDIEVKLLVGCTHQEIEIIGSFHNNDYMSAIIVRRDKI